MLFSNLFKFGSLEKLHKLGRFISGLVYITAEEVCWHCVVGLQHTQSQSFRGKQNSLYKKKKKASYRKNLVKAEEQKLVMLPVHSSGIWVVWLNGEQSKELRQRGGEGKEEMLSIQEVGGFMNTKADSSQELETQSRAHCLPMNSLFLKVIKSLIIVWGKDFLFLSQDLWTKWILFIKKTKLLKKKPV